VAIQILGLRPYIVKGRERKLHVFFEKNWRIEKPEDIFKPELYINNIPEVDRVNMYFTVADCFEGDTPRKLREQWLIPFDIDSMAMDGKDMEAIAYHCKKVVGICAATIGMEAGKIGAIFSGNGLQFFIKIKKPILADDYFDTMREHYNVVCKKLQASLTLAHIPGKIDPSVFSAARLMRLPNTWNDKPLLGKKWAFVVQDCLEEQDFDFEVITGDAAIAKADTMDKEAWKKFPRPDQPTILAGCSYLKWCKDSPNKVSEEQWYAMLGILSFLPDGAELVHEYSSGYAKYDAQETEEKSEQARRAAGPRTCTDIGKRWDGCKGCAHYGAVKLPLAIRGENYIATKDTGFRNARVDKNGKLTNGPVDFEDLIKEFLMENEFAKVDKNGMYVYKPTEKKWIEFSQDRMREWSRNKVYPRPSSNEMKEFVGRMQSHSVKPSDWLNSSDDRHTNFSNGVLDRQKMELKPHSSEYGFKYVLPFEYNPYAKAPRFEKFIDEITQDDKEKGVLLKEFGGYCLSGDNYWLHKALVIIGGGANGKSVYMETLAALAGQGNYSTARVKKLGDATVAYGLLNKLFNYSEESSIDSFAESDIFKAVTSGGEVQVRHYYEQPFAYKNRAKIVMACNELPYTRDVTAGMFRRLIFLELTRTFSEGEMDHFLKDKLVLEASGIYNILLGAYAKAKAAKKFTVPQSSRDVLEEYRLENDYELAFAKDNLSEREGAQAKVADIYESYLTYCQLAGHKYPKTRSAFSRRIGDVLGIKSTFSWVDGKATRIYEGIHSKTERAY
jgi:P4 family phage/plasmid primase-like protien